MADTWTVCPSGCNFTSIQGAIDAASEGDTILVYAGEYHECPVVNKTLFIVGEDANTTIVNGDYLGDVITIEADGAGCSQIHLTGSVRYASTDEEWPGYGIGVINATGVTLYDCIVTDCQVGIYGMGTEGISVTGNQVDQNDVEGILFEQTINTICSENTVHDNYIGIMALWSTGDFSCRNNQITHNQATGLCFLDGVENAVVEENLIQDNTYMHFESLGDYNRAGGYFEFVENMTIRNNRFIHNGGVGLLIDGMSESLVDGNILEENYAGFSYHDGNPAPQNTIPPSNTVDGLPILYLEDVQDRDITGSEYATIYLVGCRNINVHDIVMSSPNGFGILVRGGDHITLGDNFISNNLYQNILVSHVQDAKIIGNRLEGATYGAGVLASSFVNVTGNHAVGNSRGLAAASENEYVWFFNNTLERNMAGFSFEDEEGREISVTGNRITGNNPALHLMDLGIFIQNSDNIHAWDNHVSSVYEGVFLYGGEMNVLEDNTLSNCEYGIELSPYSPGIPGEYIPVTSNWVTHNDVSARKIAFFTTSDQEYVYSNYVYLNNFVSDEEPPSTGESPHMDDWDSASLGSSHAAWGLPRSSNPSRDQTVGSSGNHRDNTFNTESPLLYDYQDRIFKGYLGNYWNWYTGTDTSGNGIGTTPYHVRVNNTDHYPLLSPVVFYAINPSPPFHADFEGSPVEGASPLTVRFTDHSVGNPFRYLYRFGDGFTSMSQNPVHTYRLQGNYTVSLTLYQMDGRTFVNTTTYRAGYIRVETAPEPVIGIDFTGAPLSGQAPLQVRFTGSSTISPIMWKYSFGDGFLSTQQNPVHTYRKSGNYTVKLTVWAFGPDNKLITKTKEREYYIKVT